jgi:hypothetical protein
MYQADANLKQSYAVQIAGSNSYATPEVAQTEAEFILERMRTIRGKLSDVHGMSKVANEKIIGPAPSPLPTGESIGKTSPISQGFLANISQILGEIDSTSSEIAEQLSRLHRSF